VVVTSSLNKTGRAVACVQLVPVVVDVVVWVAAVAVVVVVLEPHRLLAEEASMSTRGRPDVIGTAMFPLESTVTDVQVYISMSLVPDEYPLPLNDKV
jgi:hypothetical protein